MPVTINGTTGIATPDGSASVPPYTGSSGATNGLYFPSATTAAITTNGTQALYIDASQNIGIGVTPSAWSGYRTLQLGTDSFVGGNSSASLINLGTNCYYNGTSWIYSANGPASQYYQLNSAHIWRTSASGTAGNPITFTQAMTLDASGRLLVGTTTGNNKVVITSDNATFAHINGGNSPNDGATPWLGTGNSADFATSYYGWGFYNSSSNGNLNIYSREGSLTGSLVMALARSTGNVGIGTSSPGARLDVYGGAGAVTTTIRAASGQNAFLSVMGNGNAFLSTSFDIIQDSTNAAQIFQRANGPLLFGTNNTERARFNAGAPILCLAGGNTSATGTGIAFPATQSASSDANTLDDYEEGAWTPTLASGTWNLRNATYTKIGRQVTVELWADTFSSTVNIINGLPFVANSYSPGVAHNNSGNAYVARAGASSTDVYLRNYADASIALNSMGSFLIFTITYFTT